MITQPLTIFQIGDMPLWESSFNYQYQGENTSWDNNGETFLDSGQVVFANKQGKHKPRSVTINSRLRDNNFGTADQKLLNLHRISSYPIDIIAFAMCDTCSNCGCSDCSCDSGKCPELIWFQNRGVITSLKVNSRSDNNTISISITLSYDYKWLTLNNLFWSFGDVKTAWHRPNTDLTTYTTADEYNLVPDFAEFSGEDCQYISRLPNLCDIIDNCNSAFYKTVFEDPNVMYLVSVWETMYPNFILCDDDVYPQKVSKGCQYGISRTFNGDVENILIPNPQEHFSSAPESIYQFKGNPTSGTIQLSIERRKNIWESETVVSSLNLATVNSDLAAAGHGGLEPHDRIVAGSTFIKPSFVIRPVANGNWTVLSNVAPAWDYSGEFVGEGSSFEFYVTMTAPTSVKMAMMHKYGRY